MNIGINYNIIYCNLLDNSLVENINISTSEVISILKKYDVSSEGLIEYELFLDNIIVKDIDNEVVKFNKNITIDSKLKLVIVVFKYSIHHIIFQAVPHLYLNPETPPDIIKYRLEEPAAILLPIIKDMVNSILKGNKYSLPDTIFLEHYNQLTIKY